MTWNAPVHRLDDFRSASMVERPESSLRAPWLDTMTVDALSRRSRRPPKAMILDH